MARDLALSVLDQELTVRGSDDVLALLADLWQPFVLSRVAGAAAQRLECDPSLCCDAARVAAASVEINRAALSAWTGPAVHAGVVSDGRQTIVLPAPSGVGKSTMVFALVRAGWRYVSDEALCLQRGTHCVRSYPKPVAVDAHVAQEFGVAATPACHGKVLVPAAALGDIEASPTLRVTDLVVLNREYLGPPAVVPLTPTVATERLISLCFNHFRDPEASFRAATDVAGSCRAWRFDAAQSAGAVAVLTEALATAQGGPPPYQPTAVGPP